MAILRNDTTVRSADGQTTSAIITSANIGNYGISTTSTYYIGTTQNVFNRASGAQTLTGVSIDGNAANITAYTINQNVGTSNTPSFAGIVSSAITNYAFLQVTDTNNFWITPGNNNWGLYFETSAGGLLGGSGDSNRLGFVGAGAARFYVDLNNGNGWFGASLTANTDSRAPIFYDTNNTAYFLDPTSTSNLNAITLNNSGSGAYLNLPGSVTVSNVSGGEVVFRALNQLRFSTSSSWDWNAWAGLKYDASATTIYLGGPAANTIFSANATPPSVTVSFVGTSNVTSDSNIKAPIFYDSNDTTYYVDPASNSRLLNLGLGNVTPDLRLSVSGDAQLSGILYLGGTAGSYSSWGSRTYTTSGILYNNSSSVEFNNYGYGSTWTFTLGGGNATSSGSFRAPIFYDSDNTAYYLDAANSGTSLLVAGNVGIGTTSASRKLIVNGDAAFATNSGGLVLASFDSDTGHIRPSVANGSILISDDSGALGRGTEFLNGGGVIIQSLSGFTPLEVKSNSSTLLFVASGGNVGVGTTSPYGKIDLGSTTGAKLFIYGNGGNTSYITGLGTDISGSSALSFFTGAGRFEWMKGSGAYPYASYSTQMILDSSSNLIITSSVRSPIFYDSDNTAYYINAASVSNLNAVTLADNIDVGTYIYLRNNLRMLNSASNGWIETIVRNSGSPYFTNPIDGGTFLASDGAENNNWLFQENARGWGLFYFNRGTQSGQTFGSYTTVGAETFIIGQGSGTTMTSTWTGYNASSKVAIMLSNYTGYIWANDTIFSATGLRAPIFYDSNDTNYYLDPAGTSRLNTTRIGNINVGSGTYLNTITPIGDTNINLSAPSGAFFFDTFPRMPGFYDSADTTYYIDPASTSRIVALWVRGSSETVGNIYVGGTAAGDRLNINYDQIWTPNGNLHLQYSGGGNIDMNFGGGHAFSRTSLRAPIFYDYNDTAYYVDAASTSVLNRLNYQQLRRNFGSATYSGPPSGSNNVKTFSGVLVAGSANGSTNSYTVIETNVPQGSYQMGGFTINWFENYSSTNGKTKIEIAGYWNPTSNGGFVGFEFTTTNPNIQPTIQVGANASGNTVFILSHFSSNYPVIVARDLWFGYNSTDAEWGTGWTMTNTNSLAAYSNIVSAVCRTGPTLTGSGASGSWGINITGTSSNITSYTINQNLGTGNSPSFSTIYAGVFYDNDDTTYYTNPSVLSNIVELKTNKNWYDSSASAWGGGINMGGNSPSIGFQSTASTWWYMLHHSSSAINFYRRSTSGSWNQDGIWDSSGNYIWQGSSVRGQIFYDNNNTSYYLDPANSGTSLLVAGKVGLGTTSAISMLDVRGAHASGYGIINVISTDSALIALDSTGARDHGIRLKYNGVDKWLVGMRDTNESYSFSNSSDTRLVTILQGGNVGIGTTSPSEKLDVTGRLKLNNSGCGWLYGNDTNHSIILRGNRDGTAIDESNYHQFGGTLASGKGHKFWTNGVLASQTLEMQIANDGVYIADNLGIGTTGPSQKLHVVGTGFASSDFRAPIFYDSNDTTYYTDPASFSLISSMGIGGLTSSSNTGMYDSYVDGSSSYFQSPPLIIRKDSSATGAIDQAPVGLFIYNLNGTNNTWTKLSMGSREAVGAGNTVSIAGLAAQKTAGTANSWATGDLHFWTKSGATQITNMVAYSSGYVQSGYSFRAPIFYDSNDTTYYIDAASTSQLNQVASYYLRNLAAVSTDHQFGLYFNNSIDTAYAIYREGGAWTNPYPDLRIAFHTGIKIGANAGYNGVRFYDDYGMANQVMSVNNSSDGLGANNVYVNNALQAGGSLRAPIFYDSNDTGYYIDAASTSSLNSLISTEVYARNWFRNDDSGEGIYNQATTQHFYSDDVSYWNVASSSGVQGIRFRTGGHGGTVRGYIYANDSNDVGLLNNSGNWRVRIVGGDYALFDGSSVRAQTFIDSNNTAYYVDPGSTSNLNGLNVVDANLELYKSQTVDMSNTTTYSTSNYYPVTIPVPTEGCIIQIQNNLNSNVPSWATHGGGFTLNLRWRTNGSGWGTTQVRRYIEQYFEQFTNQTICGGISQMTNSSTEVIWLRGGGQYYFKFSRNLSATAQSATYTINSQSVSPTSTAQNTIWNSANGSAVLYNDTTYSTSNMYTPVLYDYNNSAYFVDPASTSNLVGLTVANTITGSITGNAGGSSASCTGNAATATRTSGQSGYPHAGTGMWAFYNWGGSDGGTSAPSASTYTTGLSVGSNPGDQAYGFQIANNMWNTGLWTRNYNSGFGSWIRLLDSSNYVGYSAFTGNVDGTQFRDANNTAYYIDPASTSNLVGLTVANTITGAVSGNAGSVTINYNNDSNSTYQMLWGSGNNVYGTAGVYLNPSTDVLYANAFYDAGNTAYYLDPNSTSNLLLVKTRNTFGERIAVTAASSTTIDTQYNVTELTMSTNVSLTLSNIQSSGTVHMWTIVTVGNGTAYSIGWPAAIKWPGGTAPTITSTNTKRDIYQFVTYDGGTTIFAIIVGQNL